MGNATSARSWKKSTPSQGAELALPSENVALVRPLSPQAFLSGGFIPDPLTSIITEAVRSKKGLPPKVMDKITEDKDLLMDTLQMFDRTMCYVVIEPVVSMPPTCVECKEYYNVPQHRDMTRDDYHQYKEGERNPDILYADEVDMDDKIFIFQWCLGGTRDLDRFREELKGSMESVSDGKVIPGTSKRASGRR